MMPEPQPAQPWTTFEVASFAGMFDTHIKTGECYTPITLADIFAMEPESRAKGSGLAFIPSSYTDHDAREHSAQRERGSFVALTGDVDKGDHKPAEIQQAVKDFAQGAAYLIYSSAHARPGDMRWRIIVPLAMPQVFETWYDAQCAFFAFMEARGIQMDHALARAAQPVYLPNVPAIHAKSDTALRGEDGSPLYYKRTATALTAPGLSLETEPVAGGIADLQRKRAEDEAERERIRREAETRRAAKPRGDGASIIDDFNASNSVATMLEICGYEQSPRSAEDWRSPHQAGETYATRIIGSKWVSLSASDASARIGESCKSGCFGDAYDLYVHYKHGGDHKGAYRALRDEHRAANVIYPDPPQWMAEVPDYDDMPDWGGDPGEIEPIDIVPITISTAPRSLPFEWAGQAQPVIDGFWLIEDWLPKTGIAAVYGHPGSGKSFLTIDMAAHVAAGVPWAGKHVERGLVVYVVAEGQTGFRNRLFAMQRAGKIEPDAPFIFIPSPIDLQAPQGDLDALCETVLLACDQAGASLAMIVVDTLSKTFGAGKENTDDMVSYVNNCQRLASRFECLTLVVHHRPKDSESKDMRGHSSLRGNIDTTILVEAGDIKSATTLKQKDGEDNICVRFKLERVVIGEDRRGKEISTCLTEIIDGEIPVQNMDPSEARKNRLTGHKRMSLRVIEEVISKAGVEPPSEIPSDAIDRYRTWKAVTSGQIHDRLRAEFYGLENGDEDKRRDNARRNTNRALKDLKSAEILGSWGDWMWLN